MCIFYFFLFFIYFFLCGHMFYHVSKACGASFQAEESHAVICSVDDIELNSALPWVKFLNFYVLYHGNTTCAFFIFFIFFMWPHVLSRFEGMWSIIPS